MDLKVQAYFRQTSSDLWLSRIMITPNLFQEFTLANDDIKMHYQLAKYGDVTIDFPITESSNMTHDYVGVVD